MPFSLLFLVFPQIHPFPLPHYSMDPDVQKRVFRRQLNIAMESKKPLVIHCRDAHHDCITILKEVIRRFRICIQLEMYGSVWKNSTNHQ